jgi:hypothetical protein
MRDDSSVSKRVGAAGIALLVALSMVAGVGLVSAGGTDDVAAEETAITFEDQAIDGETVVVEEVTLEEGGFVAIHNASLLDGNTIGSVVGVSAYLEAGTHEDVEVTLFEGVEGVEYDQSSLEEDGTLIAMPHLDTNDNEAYDFVASEGSEDGPYTENGEAVVDSAEITVEATDDEADEGDSQKADKKQDDADEAADDTEETETEDGADDAESEDTNGEETEDMEVTAEDVEGAMDAMGVDTDTIDEMGMSAQDIADLLNEMIDALQSASGGSSSA